MAAKKGGLGRGLDALFADVPVSVTEAAVPDDGAAGEDSMSGEYDRVRYINIHDIMPNTSQPRKNFDEAKISELAGSIREHGIIQPIVVREVTAGGDRKGYEIVAGERRWRAAMEAGLTEVPGLIRTLDDEQNMLFAIIENMQREDLNPIEEAEGLEQMIEKFGLTQEQVSDSIGKSRPYITNSLRLLKLPEYIQKKITDGEITAGHGRALITLGDEESQIRLCDRIIKENLSVRETERIAAEAGAPSGRKPAKLQKNPNVIKVEEDLKSILGTKVNIVQNGKKSKIEIECYSRDELDRLIDMLKKLV